MKKTINKYFCDLCFSEITDININQFDKNLVFNTYHKNEKIKREVVELEHLCLNCEKEILNTIEKLKKKQEK